MNGFDDFDTQVTAEEVYSMSDLQISDRLAELDPMEYEMTIELRTERYQLLWERYRRNRADSAIGRGT